MKKRNREEGTPDRWLGASLCGHLGAAGSEKCPPFWELRRILIYFQLHVL